MENNSFNEVIVGIYLKFLEVHFQQKVRIVQASGKRHHDTVFNAIIDTRTILVQALVAMDGHCVLACP